MIDVTATAVHDPQKQKMYKKYTRHLVSIHSLRNKIDYGITVNYHFGHTLPSTLDKTTTSKITSNRYWGHQWRIR